VICQFFLENIFVLFPLILRIIIAVQSTLHSSLFFLLLSASRLLSEQKTMYCDRSAYYQKAIKAIPTLFNKLAVGMAFFAFWAINLNLISL
jgi:hypothetical protein